MKYRQLTRNIQVSVLGFGGAALSGKEGGYGFGDVDEEVGYSLIDNARRLGINVFDSAPIYGFGQSERRIGQYLRANPQARKEMVLVTKGGITWNEQRYARIDNSPEVLKRSIDQSLADLHTDVIDVYMIHWPDPNVRLDESLTVIENARSDGRVRAVGVSNFSVELLKRAREICPIEVVQGDFSVFNASNSELIQYCSENAIGFMAYGTLAKGMLAGTAKAGRHYDDKDHRSYDHHMVARLDKLRAIQGRYLGIVEKIGVSPSALALAWAGRKPGVSTLLCGAKSQKQQSELIDGVSFVVPDAIVRALDEMSREATPLYYEKA